MIFSSFLTDVQVPFLPGSYGVDEYHEMIENRMVAKYEARPHWAKNNFLNSEKVNHIYPKVSQWRQISSVFNQSATFSNAYSDQCGLTSTVRSNQPIIFGHNMNVEWKQPISFDSCSNRIKVGIYGRESKCSKFVSVVHNTANKCNINLF